MKFSSHTDVNRIRAFRALASVLLAVVVAVAGLAAGCGDDEHAFTAAEFVAEANRNGATLVLGEPLIATETDSEIRGVTLEPEGAEQTGRGSKPAEHEGESHRHGGGSLRVEDSAEAAEEEHRRCETSGLVLCFRAANVVVAFDQEADPRRLAALAAAIRAMKSG